MPLNWYKLLIKTLSSTLKTMFTQPCRDAITVTWRSHFHHFTSEHYKVSKMEVFETVILQPIFESLLMTCAKTCKNWWMCVKPVKLRTFFETHCILSQNFTRARYGQKLGRISKRQHCGALRRMNDNLASLVF